MNIPFLSILIGIAVLAVVRPGLASEGSSPKVLLKTNMGNIVIELDPQKAPKTVENFLSYVRAGFYEGTLFHRVIPGFMVQGGGYTQDYTLKKTHRPIQNEADNGLLNLRGTIAMARTSNPHSATSQFFINVTDNDPLNYRSSTPQGWGYTVFGRVTEGMEVVDAIVNTPTGRAGPFAKDAPQKPVIIEKASVEGEAGSPTTE
jgi:peptidyl-prolyl cis-trans isomerase B (cyclophilin B)